MFTAIPSASYLGILTLAVYIFNHICFIFSIASL